MAPYPNNSFSKANLLPLSHQFRTKRYLWSRSPILPWDNMSFEERNQLKFYLLSVGPCMGHPFMTSTWKGRGSDSGGRGQRHVDVRTKNYNPVTSSCLLLMQRSCRFFTKISSLNLIKSGIFCQYKLVISINNRIV